MSRKLDHSTPLLQASFDVAPHSHHHVHKHHHSHISPLRQSTDDNRIMENTNFRQHMERGVALNSASSDSQAAFASSSTDRGSPNRKVLKKLAMHREKSIKSLLKGDNINALPNLMPPSATVERMQLHHTKSRNEGMFSATTGTTKAKREAMLRAAQPLSTQRSFDDMDSCSDSDSSQSSWSSDGEVDTQDNNRQSRQARNYSDKIVNSLSQEHASHIGGLKLVTRMNSTRGPHDHHLFHRKRSNSHDFSPAVVAECKKLPPLAALPPLPRHLLQPAKAKTPVPIVSTGPSLLSHNNKQQEVTDSLRDLCMSPRSPTASSAAMFASMQSPRPEPVRLGSPLHIKTGLLPGLTHSPANSPGSPSNRKHLAPLDCMSPRQQKKSPIVADGKPCKLWTRDRPMW
eukprot:gene27594-34338_t